MAKSDLTVRVHIEGASEVERALTRLPPQAKALLAAKTLKVAESLAGAVRTAAQADSRQSALLATTVRPVRGTRPAVTAGGTSAVGRNRKPAYKVLFGSEFGAHVLRQFRPFRRSGYWFFRTVEAEQPRMNREWRDVADEVVRKFGA